MNMTQLHQGQPVLATGVPLTEARLAMIMLHGRGATAESILSLAQEFTVKDTAYLAPRAVNNTWYPYRFLSPIERNEPWLSSALQVIDDLIAQINAAGLSTAFIRLLGFSQGACLALDYAARHAQRFGGVFGLSGGLIGSEIEPQRYAGSFAGTPIFLGCSDIDPHIPLDRVQASAQLLTALGGDVTTRIYAGMDHIINQDEIDFVGRQLLGAARPT